MPSSAPPPRHGRAREPRRPRVLDTATAFRASMPARYRHAFDGLAVREHAAIVARRAGASAHAEIWRREPEERAVMCVVADDRPGLLSFVSASLATQRLDVISAQAYTRTPADGGDPEAVDFLWVRRGEEEPEPIRSADAVRVSDVLRGLIAGKLTMESVRRQARPVVTPPPGGTTKVSFDETREANLSVLTVTTFDRPGLLLAITLALFRAQVQIVASEVMTENGQVVDRFTIAELDGSPVVGPRRGAGQTSALSRWVHAVVRAGALGARSPSFLVSRYTCVELLLVHPRAIDSISRCTAASGRGAMSRVALRLCRRPLC
jgi:[protein-PII] uridylyltransferase